MINFISLLIWINFVPKVFSSVTCNEYCIICQTTCKQCVNGYYLGATQCEACSTGFYSDGITCSPCDSACKTCSDLTICSDCNNNYYFDNHKCIACSQGCQICTSAQVCTTCQNNFEIASDSCVACTSSQYFENGKCLNCSNTCGGCTGTAENCTSCKEGNYLYNNKCNICDTTCNGCTAAGNTGCSQCATGYSKIGGSCTKCIDNCSQCESVSTCKICQDEYFGPTCTQKCINGCLKCTDSSTCQDCKPEYYLSFTICSPCSSPCQTCAGMSTCLTCVAGYYFDQGYCMRCATECSECTGGTALQCSKCSSTKYYLDGTACKSCPVSCLSTCTNVDQVKCDACAQGYYGENCEKCMEGCKICEQATSCTTCLDGYYLSGETDQICKQCTSDCKVCDKSICITCNTGYIRKYENKACGVPCTFPCLDCTASTVCLSCKETYYYDIVDKNCKQCMSPCYGCDTTSTTCTSCVKGKYVNDKTCNPCPIKCKDTCFYKLNLVVCETCADGYVKDGEDCVTCSPVCKTCNVFATFCTSCYDKTYFSDNQCLACFDNCEICQSVTAYCTTCASGYQLNSYKQCEAPGFSCPDAQYYELSSSTCQACTSICTQCFGSKYNLCSECISGYYLVDSTCTLCKSPCINCTSKTSCLSCIEGKYLKGVQCVDCESPCKYCKSSGNTNCQSCVSKYYLSNNICEQCVSKCLNCNSLTTCQACESGYYLDSNNLCPKCIEPCDECTDITGTVCSSCVDTYYFDTDQCNKCITPCIKCSSSTECITCVDGTYLEGTDCPLCDSACKKCSISSTNCSACSDKYYLSGNSCLPCVSPCEKCIDQANKCLTCDTLNKYLVNYSCIDCVSPCINCKSQGNTNCQSCVNKYFLENSICYSCKSPCLNCTSLTSCLTCIVGYYLSGTECLKCNTNCKTCINLADNCTSCYSRYYLETNNTCSQCQLPCFDCQTKSVETCISCIEYYYLNANICERCVSPCLTCTSISNCKLCVKGYYISNTSTCSQCDQNNCLTCIDNSLKCLSCAPGKYLENNNCQTCDTKCKTCTSLTSCQSCNTGYYIFGSLCLECQLPCIECNSATVCTKCKDNSYIISQNQCIHCTSPCATCNQQVCLSCIDGYYFESDTCQICQSPCKFCNLNGCLSCIQGYYLNDTQCNQCTNNCLTCESATICTSCTSSYYLNNQECVKCNEFDINCLTCINQDRCLSCKDQFYVKFTTINDLVTSTCEACSEKCINCEEQPNQCTACAGNRINTPWCSTCQDGYFETGQLNCQQCDSKYCSTCTDSSKNCTSCAEKRISPPNCICKSGTYSSNDDCLPCMNNCQLCDTDVDCQKCNAGYYYKINQCTEICGDNYYAINQTCVKCKIDICKTCSENGCTQCFDKIIKDQKDSNNNVCLSEECPLYISQQNNCLIDCPSGYYKKSDFTCQICDQNCLKCLDSSTECTQCYPNYFMQYVVQSVKGYCVKQCPTSFYPSGSVCMKCPETCNECTDEKTCKSCSTGLYLFNKSCVADCGLNSGYYGNIYYTCEVCALNCLACTSPQPQDCTKCNDTTYKFQFKCQESCPQGYYADQDRVCQICNTQCLTCNGPLETNCLSCGDRYLYIKSKQSCTTICPENYFLNLIEFTCETCMEGCQKCENTITCQYCSDQYFLKVIDSINICVTDCPDGYYGQLSGRVCKLCDLQCLTCTGSKVEDCLICADQKIYYQGECIDECPSGTFFDINYQKCEKCSDGCVQCLNMNNCINCESGYKQYNNLCYLNCPSGSYEQDQTCKQCISNCITCNNNINCLKCNQQSYLIDNICQSICPNNQYGDTITRSCQYCDQTCSTCFGSSYQNCLTCQSNYLYKNQCIEFCPNGYFADKTLNICSQCLSTCSTCLDNKTCLQCPQGIYLSDGLCLTSCPDQYYQEAGTRTCQQCFLGCLKCFGSLPDQCFSCLSGYYLFNYSCKEECSDGTFKNTNTNTCEKCHYKCNNCIDSSEACTQCAENTYLNTEQHRCVDIIPEKYMVDLETRVLVKCPANCRTCNQVSCTSCLNRNFDGQSIDYYLFQNTCVESCINYYGDASSGTSYVCVLNCPKLTFENQSLKICEKCHNTCLECSGTQSNQCLLCFGSQILQNGVCTDKCSDGFYLDDVKAECMKCDSNCDHCDGPTADDCTTCLSNQYLQNGKCQSQCNAEYFGFICTACHYTCQTCQGILKEDCITCKLGYFLVKVSGQCVQDCQNGYYANTVTNTCDACDSSCKTCSWGGSGNCLECQNQLLMEGICTSTCNDGFYKDDLECKKCDPICKTCNNNYQCLSCIDQFYLFNLKCIQTCIDGYYRNIDTCSQCMDYCLVCSDNNTCQLCDASKNYFLFNNQCYQLCNDSEYFDEISLRCMPCNEQCLTCSGSESTQCLTCDTGKLLQVINDEQQCLSECLQDFIPEYELGICLQKQCDSSCQTCLYNNLCLTCSGNLIYFQNTCLEKCQDGYYYDKGCQPCNEYCSKCQNDTNSCEECSIIALRKDDTFCVKECPIGYTVQTQKCIKCVDKCLYCIYDALMPETSNNTKCLKCENNYFLDTIKDSNNIINTQCILNCPDGKYQDKIYQTCQSCHWNCSKCTSSSILDCTQCGVVYNPQTTNNETRFMEDSLCQLTCSNGSFAFDDTINGNKCIPCDSSCQSCKGLTNLDCTSCYYNTYLFNNQCINKENCPIGYYANTLNKQCQNCYIGCTKCIGIKFNQCLECQNGYYFLINQCLQNKCPIEYYQSNQQCIKCYENCQECIGSGINQCLSCIKGVYFYPQYNSCHIQCPIGSFLNKLTFICQSCDLSCLTCFDEQPTSCLQCKKYKLNGLCVNDCGLHKYANQNQVCQECSYKCNECQDHSENCINNCAGNRQNLPDCTCPSGFQKDSPNSTCTKCYYKCSSCDVSYANCLECAQNRTQNPPYCSCPAGYFEEEGTQNPECQVCAWQCATCQYNKHQCTTCRGDRVGNECVCLPGKFEDEFNKKENCTDCDFSCSSCIGKATYCTRCKGNRVQQINQENLNYYQCECPQYYYNDGKYANCLNCDFKCATCSSKGSNCTLCRGDRILKTACNCALGYFDDEIQGNCQKCDISCYTCDKTGCLICAGNREGPNIQKQCTCPDTGIDRRAHKYSTCSTCDLGVPFIQLQDSLNSIVIYIGGNIKIKDVDDPTIGSRENCQKIFSTEDFNKLGKGVPLCYVDPGNTMQIIVELGYEAKLQVGSSITLNIKGQFGRKDCSKYFTQMLSAVINLPDSPAIGYVKFTGPQYIDLCSQIQFYPSQNFNDGGRGFTMKSWSIKLPDDPNVKSAVQLIFDKATTIKNSKITIPELTLQEYTQYVFTYTYTNFLGQELSSDYTLTTTTFESPSVQIQELAPHNYNSNVRITLIASIQHLSCRSGVVQIVDDSINYSWISEDKVYEGEKNNILSTSESLKGIKYPNVQYISLMIPPYSGIAGLEYQVTLQATLINKPETGNYTVNIYLKKQGLQAQINGGSRVNGYAVPLYVEGWANDPNIGTSKGINLLWKCIDLIDYTPCKDLYENEIILNNTNKQSIAAKQLVPYHSYKFYLNSTKGDLYKVDSIVIVIIELDLPLLELSKPDYLTSESINMNQEINMKFIYPTFDPDSFYYGGALIYDYSVVAILRFYYTSITIKFWDSFYELKDLAQIGFRASVYDPHYFMPSTASLLIDVNIPPKNCKLSVYPTQGLSFDTMFYVEVNECEDSDRDFTYKFSYYTSPSQYESDIIKAHSLNQILLQDYQSDNFIQTILPYPEQDQDIIIQPFIILMVTVQDQQGGVTNLTSSVVVGINDKDLKSKLLLVEKIKRGKIMSDQFIPLSNGFGSRLLSELIQTDRLEQIFLEKDSLPLANQISMLNLLAVGVQGLLIDDSQANKTFIQQEQQKLVILKSNILMQLRYFQKQDVSVATKSQLVKSIEFMMNDKIMQQNMTSSNINVYLSEANVTVFSSIEQINQIISDINNGYVDYRLFEKKQNLQNDIMRAAGQLDGILSAIQSVTDQKENNRVFLSILERIKQGFILTDNPNASPKVYIGTSFSMKSQIVTKSKLTENLGGVNPLQKEQSIQISEDDESQLSTSDTIIYHQTEFFKNPYATDETFPQRSIYSTIQSIEPILKNGSILVPQQPIPIKFNVIPAYERRNLQFLQDLQNLNDQPFSESLFCIGKSQTGEWDVGGGNCKSYQEIDATGAVQLTCRCQQFTITTVQDSITDIINTDKFTKAFTVEAVLALLRFPFYKSILVYAMAFMTGGLIMSVGYGFKKDLQESQEKLLQIHYIESEYIRIMAMEKKKKKIEKQKKNALKLLDSSRQLDRLDQIEDPSVQLPLDEESKIEIIILHPDQDPEELIQEMSSSRNIESCSSNNMEERDNMSNIFIKSKANEESISQCQTPNEPIVSEIIKQKKGKQIEFTYLQQKQIVDEFEESKQQSENQEQQFKKASSKDTEISHKDQNENYIITPNLDSLRKKSSLIRNCQKSNRKIDKETSIVMKKQDSLNEESCTKQKKSKKVQFNVDQNITKHQSQDSNNSDSSEEETTEPNLEEKEDLVIQWHRDYKRQKFIESKAALHFTLTNVLLFISLFHSLFAIFYIFERKLPRPFRFCVIYMTILNTCYINIYFQVPLQPVQSIIFSIFSAVASNVEILIIQQLMVNKLKIVRLIGWIIFTGITALLIYVIIVSMAFEANNSNGDVSKSNAWGLNFIISFGYTNFISDPLKLIIAFKAVQLSLNNSKGVLNKILIAIFVNPATNVFFEMIDN